MKPISYLILVTYLLIGFIPNLGAVDKIAPQWLGLSLLNGITYLIFLIKRKSFANQLTTAFLNPISILYILFITWAGLSYFYAINPVEVIVNFTRQVNVLAMYFAMLTLLFTIGHKEIFLSIIIALILFFEVYAILDQALTMLESKGAIFAGSLKGVTANRNIAAFSIAIKIPFVYFLITKIKKLNYRLLLSILLFFSFLALTMIQSRASYLATGFGMLSILSTLIYLYTTNKEKNSKKRFIQSITLVFLSLVFALFTNVMFLSDKGANALDRAATIANITTDDSITARLRYYSDVLNHVSANPILGTGLGNWKIKSIDYDKYDIKGYVVPYHAHSDFIQLGAELGILGFLLYLGIFIIASYFALKVFTKNSTPKKEQFFSATLLIALGIYSVDASLNFPIARPQVLVVWTLIIAFLSFYFTKFLYMKKIKKDSPRIIGLGLLLIFSIIVYSSSVTNKVYASLKTQMLILQDFNSNKYNLPLNQIETFIPPIPNITVTTIPMDAIKARYYFYYKKYDKALALSEKAKEANPYLRYPEILQSQIYAEKGEREKAWEYAKVAFENLPRNPLHSSQFINLSMQLGKRDAIRDAFPLLTLHNEFNNWKNYLVAVAQLFPPGLDPFVRQAEQAAQLFPGNQDILNLQRLITLGAERINSAAQYSQEGLNFFNEQDYANAAVAFEKAIAANPLDYAHFENVATSYYLLNDIEKGLEKIDVVITSLNPNNGKCEYIKALLLMRMQDAEGACPLFKTAVNKGYTSAQEMLKSYCNQ